MAVLGEPVGGQGCPAAAIEWNELEAVAPGANHRRSVGMIRRRTFAAIALCAFEDDVELAAPQKEPRMKQSGCKQRPARVIAARPLPFPKFRSKANGFRPVEVDAPARNEVELVAEPPQKG